MASGSALTPLIVGDPVRPGAEVADLAGLLGAVGLAGLDTGAWRRLAPGVGLVLALMGRATPALRWARLGHPTALAPAGDPVDLVAVLLLEEVRKAVVRWARPR